MPRNTYLIYLCIILGGAYGTQILRMGLFYTFGFEISLFLHHKVIFRMLHASINKFFNKHPKGKLLNRLSGDMYLIDRILIFNLSSLYFAIGLVFVYFLLIVLYSHWVMVLFLVAMCVTFYYQRIRFANTNVVVSKYDSVTMSPFYSIIDDSISGVEQIRCLKKESFYINKTKNIVNRNF